MYSIFVTCIGSSIGIIIMPLMDSFFGILLLLLASCPKFPIIRCLYCSIPRASSDQHPIQMIRGSSLSLSITPSGEPPFQAVQTLFRLQLNLQQLGVFFFFLFFFFKIVFAIDLLDVYVHQVIRYMLYAITSRFFFSTMN